MDGLAFVEESPREGRELDITPDAVIGREGTDVVLPDPEVSRRHAAVRVDGGTVSIEDLGSTNGTFVNDQRITGVRALSDGDTVRFGNTVWRLRATVAAADAPVAAPQVTAAHAMPPTQGPPASIPEPAPAPTPGPAGMRGDVPAPPEVVPSAIRRVVTPPAPGNAPAFTPPTQRRGGSAATRVEATVVCLVIALAVAITLAIYFASQ